MFRFGVEISSLRLYNGHRSLYIVVNLGRVSLWIQRWDAERQPHGLYEPSGAMTWWAGAR